MAKTKAKRKQPKLRRIRAPRALLDKAALAHAVLLMDPCGAPLTHPVYAGGDSGYLIRAETFFSFATGTTPGVTAGIMHWVPGAINTTGTDLTFVDVATGATTATLGTVAGKESPGAAFLRSQASMYRCVAACAKISYVGSESTRSGRLFWGNTSGGYLTPGDTVSPDGACNGLQNYLRTPPTEIEVKWIPNDADALLVDPNLASTVDQVRRGAITVAIGGLPVNVGLVVRLTAVYEWQPATAAGLAVPTHSRATSNNTLDQVLNYVQSAARVVKRGIDFTHMMGQVYGFMPSVPETRRLAY